MLNMPRLYIDWPLFLCLLLLCSVGIFVIYSASGESIDIVYHQLSRLAIAMLGLLFFAQLKPGQIQSWTIWIYTSGLLLLFIVLLTGDGRVHRWIDLGIFKFQPSELMKLAVPMMIANYLSDSDLPPSPARLVVAFILIAIPVALIIKQPDLGTAILVATAGLAVIFIAGIKWSQIGYMVVFSLLSLPIAWHFMYDYQKFRILTFLYPERDPLGSGYHTIQSIIAVGSGGLYGKGWLNGTQSHLNFLPERSTDFIFAVFCEEFGFLGVVGLFCLYALIIWRSMFMIYMMQGNYKRLLSTALLCTFFVYIVVNVGMVSGQLPIVGIPLPLISLGGTSMVTLIAGFGILMCFYTRRRFLSL